MRPQQSSPFADMHQRLRPLCPLSAGEVAGRSSLTRQPQADIPSSSRFRPSSISVTVSTSLRRSADFLGSAGECHLRSQSTWSLPLLLTEDRRPHSSPYVNSVGRFPASKTLSIMRGVMGSAAGASSGTVMTSSDRNSEGSSIESQVFSGRADWMHWSMSALPRDPSHCSQMTPPPMFQRSASQDLDISNLPVVSQGKCRNTVTLDAPTHQQHRSDAAFDSMSPRASLQNNLQSRSNSQQRQRNSSDSRKGANSVSAIGDPRSSASISLRFPHSIMTAGLANVGEVNGSSSGSMSLVVNYGAATVPTAGTGVVLGTGSNFQLMPFASVEANGSEGSGENASDSRGVAASRGDDVSKASPESPKVYSDSPSTLSYAKPPTVLHRAAAAAGGTEIWPPAANSGSSNFAEVYGAKVAKSSRGGVSSHDITFQMMHNILGHG